MAEENSTQLLTLTAEIVAAHVGHNRVAVAELSELIGKVHTALASLGSAPSAEAPAEAKPAVSIRSSVKPDHIICLEDGRKLTMLKRYLQTNYDMTPAEYRARWKLPHDYPMVAPDYAEKRRSLAKKIGLGRKPAPEPEPVAQPAKAKRPRKPAAAAAEA